MRRACKLLSHNRISAETPDQDLHLSLDTIRLEHQILVLSAWKTPKEGSEEMEKELLLVCLDWISANAPSLVQLLGALVPVVALVVVGYALHVTHKKGGRK
jgi:hypothetical protein